MHLGLYLLVELLTNLLSKKPHADGYVNVAILHSSDKACRTSTNLEAECFGFVPCTRRMYNGFAI